MGLQIRKVQARSAAVDDRPGAAAAILERLAQASHPENEQTIFNHPLSPVVPGEVHNERLS